MFVRPIEDITFDVMGAVLGSFAELVKRAEKNGMEGFVKGLGKIP